MRLVLLALVAMLGTADAKPKKSKKADKEGPSPEQLAAGAEALACASDTPEGYQIHTGYASNADEATALTEARREAERLAIEGLCAGKSEQRCAVIRRHVEAWKTPHYNPHTSKACVHVGVNRKYIDDDQGDLKKLDSDLIAMAVRVAEAATTITLEPPVWASTGCPAGEVGDALTAGLKNALGKQGTSLAAAGTKGASRVRVELAPTATEVVLSAELRDYDGGPATLIEGFRFAPDLFATDETGGDCRFDTHLGLEGGHRSGADGLTVDFLMQAPASHYCEGDTIAPRVRVSADAVLKVYSVSRGGEALLIWPIEGDGTVDGITEIGSFDLLALPEKGDEKLIAIAVAPSSDHAKADGWSAFCQIPGLFSGEWFPQGAAVGTISYSVGEERTGTCPARPEARAMRDQIPKLPVCPDRLGG